MRSRSGCQSCRDRHLKCVKRWGSLRCEKCFQAKRDCFQATQLHFRPVTSVRLKADDGRVSRQNLTYDTSHVWVDVPSTVVFVPQNFDSSSMFEEPDWEAEVTDSPVPSDNANHQGNLIESAPGHETVASFVTHDTKMTPPHIEPIHHNTMSPDFHRAIERPYSSHHLQSASIDTLILSPELSAARPRGSHDTISLASHSVAFSASSLGTSWNFQSMQEARLLHHYIIHLAPLLDICDGQRHFGKDIPKRAGHFPVIANAIFATASRHVSLLSGTDDNESPQYLSKCVPILIATLEDPFGHWDENMLAAVVILRQHEEMSEHDEKFHLFGSTRLLNTMSSFAADGGLRESASWTSLRQHLYFSLTTQNPLTINLTNYRDSASFRENHDEAWANRIVFVFAKILVHVFQPEGQLLSTQTWAELEAEVHAWDMSKPWTFSPLRVTNDIGTPAGGSIKQHDPTATGSWPELMMSQPAQVAALQYFCLAKIILAIYDPRLARLGFANYRQRKASETIVLENLRMVVGLAVSNRHVANAMFEATHILVACGSYLHDPKEQDAAVEFLITMQKDIGWRTGQIVRDLKEQWSV